MPASEAIRIKFCGLRTEADVEAAVEAGAWAVGFVLTESPRRIPPEDCKRLARHAGQAVRKIGVFTNEPAAEILRLVAECGLDHAQLHGDRPPGEWEALQAAGPIRAFRVRDRDSLSALEAVRGKTFLLDACVPGVAGGSGQTFDWTLAAEAAPFGRVILAGGLHAGNVAEAIRTARPWAVDVSSGIEHERGVKDHARMRAFAEAVRACL